MVVVSGGCSQGTTVEELIEENRKALMNAMKHGNVLHFCLRNGVPPSAAPASLPPVCPRLPRAVTSRLHSSCCCSGNTIPWRGLSPAGLTLTAAHAGCPPLTTDFISENFPADVWKSMDVQATEVAAADSAFIGSKVRCRRRTSPPAAASQHHRPSPCRCLAAPLAISLPLPRSTCRCLAAPLAISPPLPRCAQSHALPGGGSRAGAVSKHTPRPLHFAGGAAAAVAAGADQKLPPQKTMSPGGGPLLKRVARVVQVAKALAKDDECESGMFMVHEKFQIVITSVRSSPPAPAASHPPPPPTFCRTLPAAC